MKNLFYTCHNLIYVLHEYKKNVEEYKNKRKKRRRNKIFALAINVRINTQQQYTTIFSPYIVRNGWSKTGFNFKSTTITEEWKKK